MRAIASSLFFCIALLFVGVSSSFAAAATAPITVSKTVLNPVTNMYVHSLAINDPMYKAGDLITFHITVANGSNEAFSGILVQDVFPDYVNFVSGTGNFDASSKTLSFTVDELQPGTTQTFAVTGQIVDASKLPANQNSTCAANRVLVKVNGVQTAHDSSSFCMQKVYAPSSATATPSTGPEAFPLLGLFGTGSLGFFLKKFSKK